MSCPAASQFFVSAGHELTRPRSDLRWRPVATYRGTDANPKERFIFHSAGLAGRGSSSYIDAVIMRDKNANTAWDAVSDATLEERRYYVQNWRADVVALLESDGDLSEWIRYSAYGEATVYPFTNGDYDGSGGVDGDDVIAFLADQDNNIAAADVDRNGYVDGDDTIAFYASWDNGWMSTAWTAGGGLPAGAGQLSVTSGNRIGYAGYQFDPATEQYHVRHRVYSPEMGRWTRRDPLGPEEDLSLLAYVSNAVVQVDPWGESAVEAGAAMNCSWRSDDCIIASVGSGGGNGKAGWNASEMAGITSLDGAVEACLRLPTVAQRTACLEKLIDLFPGNQGVQNLLRQMIQRMQEITRLEKWKKVKWLNNKVGRCAALYYVYKTTCAACTRCSRGLTDCDVALAMKACWVACLAGRRAYDGSRCPAGPGHAQEQAGVGKAMVNCLSVTLEPRCTATWVK